MSKKKDPRTQHGEEKAKQSFVGWSQSLGFRESQMARNVKRAGSRRKMYKERDVKTTKEFLESVAK